MLDLVITNGMVVDGTGAPAVRADVGVRDGRIVAVGRSVGAATRTIDAEGAIVTPGFVDIHTHYDGQATWDEELLPSLAHGVTTAVLGNCGVGFAPVRPRDRDRIIQLMEGVEDIPGTALHEGIRWGWESFAEYIDALDRMPHTMNLALQVTHDPLRVYVMGERAVAGEAATPDDIAAMRTVLRAALDADAAGRETPAADASTSELVGLAKAFEGLGRGVLQAVSDFDRTSGPEAFDREMDVLIALARAAGRPLSTSLVERIEASDQSRRILARLEKAAAEGVSVRAQVAPRGIGVLLGLDATFHPFMGFPSYQGGLAPAARRARRRRRQLAPAARTSAPREHRLRRDEAVPPRQRAELRADEGRLALGRGDAHRALGARRRLRRAARDEGRSLLYFPIHDHGPGSLATLAEMLVHPLAIMGLSDGRAHVGTICDASFPMLMLSTCARDKRLFPVEGAVRRLTSEPPRWMGSDGRGVVAEGAGADLNVIDVDALALGKPRLVRDLPAGGKRFVQDARGYRATIGGGEVVRDDGATTGARPGRVLRGGGAR